jgi:hypothetical protein
MGEADGPVMAPPRAAQNPNYGRVEHMRLPPRPGSRPGRNVEALNNMIFPLTRLVVAVKRTIKTAIAFAATGILGSIESSVAADSVAPGAPGASDNWTTGLKQGLGTAIGRDSKV